MASVNDGSMDLPYESQAETYLEERFLLSGGVVVMAATVPATDGTAPALIFRFARPDGSGFHSPVLLGLNEEQASNLIGLVAQASKDAIAAARKANS